MIESSIIDKVSKIENIDKTRVKLSEDDKSAYIKNILASELNGFAYKRSIPIMQNALLGCINRYLGIEETMDNWVVYIESLILNNEKIIKQLLNKAIEIYKPIKLKEEKEKAESIDNFDNKWMMPTSKNYNPCTYEKVDCKNYLYNPCYLEITRSNPEKAFIEFINKQTDKILWWWKNGDESMKENFGIYKYIDGDDNAFRPDFIVQYKDGYIGIYDTKDAGFQEDDNKIKAEALQRYIKEENAKGNKLCGGIVIVDNGHLKINNNDEYVGFRIKPDDWKFFE